MNIYKVERPDDGWGYDEYDSFVVIANDESEARNTHPSGGGVDTDTFSRGNWPVKLADLVVTLIGVANPEVNPGVVVASFNAG